MTQGKPKLSMWESVCRVAETVGDPSQSGSSSGLLEDHLGLPLEVVTALSESYELGRELGRGTSGVVYLARDRALDRPVALKVLRPSAGERQRERFRREGRFAASLKHPGIVSVLGYGEAAGAPYLAYELVAGARSLADAMPSTPREGRVRLVAEVARAVGAAHALGIVHRDLKPANVLVAADGTVRLTDFGLGVSSSKHDENLTQTGVMVGTPLFMAPEQVRGRHKLEGPHTDVWALGVLLYACLAEHLPFDGEDLLTLGTRICTADYVPLREIDPNLDPRLAAVVEHALQVDPGKRFPNGNELAAAIDAAVDQAASPTTTNLWPIMVGVAALVLIPLLGWLALKASTPSPMSVADAPAQEVPTSDPVLDEPTEPVVTPPDAPPDEVPPPPSLPEGAVLQLPVGWTANVEGEIQRDTEFDDPRGLRAYHTTNFARMEWVVIAHDGRKAVIESTFRQLRYTWEDDSERSMADSVRFDSQRNRDMSHPLQKILDRSFSLELDLATGQVLEVRGIEAIFDDVFADVGRRERFSYRLPWLQSSEVVKIELNNLLAVFPAAPSDTDSWNVGRNRTILVSRGGGGRFGGLPGAEIEQIVGTCERQPNEGDSSVRLSWKATGIASSEPTIWTRPQDKAQFTVTATAQLSLEGAFHAEAGEPRSARYEETWTFGRQFESEQGMSPTFQQTKVKASLRFEPS